MAKWTLYQKIMVCGVIVTFCGFIVAILPMIKGLFKSSQVNNEEPEKITLYADQMKCINTFNIAAILDKSNSLTPDGTVWIHFVYPKKENIKVEEVRRVKDIAQVDKKRFNLHDHKSRKGEVINLYLGVSGNFSVQVTLAELDTAPDKTNVARRVDFLISRKRYK